ncbi:hypothetical protein [Alloscardovia omnicolens]|uniref:hypothetical protein n=1 Tax=Alloscardovia omnicolens TaxID=419015 RepID=UPI003A79BE56
MTVFIDSSQKIGTIRPELHGQFIEFLGTCINEGIWVGPILIFLIPEDIVMMF